AKARYLPWELGSQGVQVLQKIKEALDPEGLLNPGKMVPLCPNIRVNDTGSRREGRL
ncbi:MAG TPA: FAD-linked oxidase C-terminal domain-containing protein, partial [Bacillota bacterium]|nr:FAD-linked oxidase C-terminal domain-containing protein [Bacillota bacterium]